MYFENADTPTPNNGQECSSSASESQSGATTLDSQAVADELASGGSHLAPSAVGTQAQTVQVTCETSNNSLQADIPQAQVSDLAAVHKSLSELSAPIRQVIEPAKSEAAEPLSPDQGEATVALSVQSQASLQIASDLSVVSSHFADTSETEEAFTALAPNSPLTLETPSSLPEKVKTKKPRSRIKSKTSASAKAVPVHAQTQASVESGSSDTNAANVSKEQSQSPAQDLDQAGAALGNLKMSSCSGQGDSGSVIHDGNEHQGSDPGQAAKAKTGSSGSFLEVTAKQAASVGLEAIVEGTTDVSANDVGVGDIVASESEILGISDPEGRGFEAQEQDSLQGKAKRKSKSKSKSETDSGKLEDLNAQDSPLMTVGSLVDIAEAADFEPVEDETTSLDELVSDFTEPTTALLRNAISQDGLEQANAELESDAAPYEAILDDSQLTANAVLQDPLSMKNAALGKKIGNMQLNVDDPATLVKFLPQSKTVSVENFLRCFALYNDKIVNPDFAAYRLDVPVYPQMGKREARLFLKRMKETFFFGQNFIIEEIFPQSFKPTSANYLASRYLPRGSISIRSLYKLRPKYKALANYPDRTINIFAPKQRLDFDPNENVSPLVDYVPFTTLYKDNSLESDPSKTDSSAAVQSSVDKSNTDSESGYVPLQQDQGYQRFKQQQIADQGKTASSFNPAGVSSQVSGVNQSQMEVEQANQSSYSANGHAKAEFQQYQPLSYSSNQSLPQRVQIQLQGQTQASTQGQALAQGQVWGNNQAQAPRQAQSQGQTQVQSYLNQNSMQAQSQGQIQSSVQGQSQSFVQGQSQGQVWGNNQAQAPRQAQPQDQTAAQAQVWSEDQATYGSASPYQAQSNGALDQAAMQSMPSVYPAPWQSPSSLGLPTAHTKERAARNESNSAYRFDPSASLRQLDPQSGMSQHVQYGQAGIPPQSQALPYGQSGTVAALAQIGQGALPGQPSRLGQRPVQSSGSLGQPYQLGPMRQSVQSGAGNLQYEGSHPDLSSGAYAKVHAHPSNLGDTPGVGYPGAGALVNQGADTGYVIKAPGGGISGQASMQVVGNIAGNQGSGQGQPKSIYAASGATAAWSGNTQPYTQYKKPHARKAYHNPNFPLPGTQFSTQDSSQFRGEARMQAPSLGQGQTFAWPQSQSQSLSQSQLGSLAVGAKDAVSLGQMPGYPSQVGASQIPEPRLEQMPGQVLPRQVQFVAGLPGQSLSYLQQPASINMQSQPQVQSQGRAGAMVQVRADKNYHQGMGDTSGAAVQPGGVNDSENRASAANANVQALSTPQNQGTPLGGFALPADKNYHLAQGAYPGAGAVNLQSTSSGNIQENAATRTTAAASRGRGRQQAVDPTQAANVYNQGFTQEAILEKNQHLWQDLETQAPSNYRQSASSQKSTAQGRFEQSLSQLVPRGEESSTFKMYPQSRFTPGTNEAPPYASQVMSGSHPGLLSQALPAAQVNPAQPFSSHSRSRAWQGDMRPQRSGSSTGSGSNGGF